MLVIFLMSDDIARDPIFDLTFLLGFRSFSELPKNCAIKKYIDYYWKQVLAGNENELYTALHFVNNFKLIKRENIEDFETIKDKLLSQDEGNFFGIKYELDIYATLFRKSISFKYEDNPDFQRVGGDDCNIECTSTFSYEIISHSHKIFNKMKYVVGEKESKSYANRNTLLLIDITNLNYNKHLFYNNHIFNDLRTLELCTELKKNSKYGAIAFIVKIVRKEAHHTTLGIDFCGIRSNLINIKLNQIVNILFPTIITTGIFVGNSTRFN